MRNTPYLLSAASAVGPKGQSLGRYAPAQKILTVEIMMVWSREHARPLVMRNWTLCQQMAVLGS